MLTWRILSADGVEIPVLIWRVSSAGGVEMPVLTWRIISADEVEIPVGPAVADRSEGLENPIFRPIFREIGHNSP